MLNDFMWVDTEDLAARSEHLPDTLKYFLLRLKNYNIGIATCGTFIDGNTDPKESMSLNHVRCLLRRDYLENNSGPLRGKSLDKEIELCLHAFVQATRRIAANLPKNTTLTGVPIRFKK